MIKSSWTIEKGIFRLDVTVPVNSGATVILPATGEQKEIGSGTYHFEERM